MEEELVVSDAETMCHVEGCINCDVVILGSYYHAPNDLPIIFCGPCQTQVTDIRFI